MLFGSTVHVPDLSPGQPSLRLDLEEGIVTVGWGQGVPAANVDLGALREAIDTLDPPRRSRWTRKRS